MISKNFENATDMKKFIASIIPIPYKELRAEGYFEGELSLSKEELSAILSELGLDVLYVGAPKMWVTASWYNHSLEIESYAMVRTKFLDPRVMASFIFERLRELQ